MSTRLALGAVGALAGLAAVSSRRGGPNRSKGSHQRWDLYRDPAFLRWFQDSKVTDVRGAPLVVYHGTRRVFDQFSPDADSFTGAKTGALGHFFTDDALVASSFAGDGSVMPVYLSIRNPLSLGWFDRGPKGHILRGKDGFSALREAIRSTAGSETWEDVTVEDVLAWRDRVIQAGFDGLEIKTQMDAATITYPNRHMGGAFYEPHTMWVAFRPGQVKSATGNRGTWDPDDPRISFNRSSAP
jgi:hypothetical protein